MEPVAATASDSFVSCVTPAVEPLRPEWEFESSEPADPMASLNLQPPRLLPLSSLRN
jgi:hypothetical protein